MRITVGSVLLGDYKVDLPVGGFRASGEREVQRGRGACAGLGRLKLTGSTQASFTAPTRRTFPTVSQAQKWINDTAKAGGYEGALIFVYDDGTDTRFPWATAIPTDLSHSGVMVTATWRIEAGERLI